MTLKNTLFRAAALGLLATTISTAHAAACVPTQPLIPAYFWSDMLWKTVGAKDGQARWIIANPESGPGAQKYTQYQSWITNARSNGHTVIGYIATGYGAKPIAQVLSEADKYAKWYGVTEFFLDEARADKAGVAYYTSLYNKLQARYPGANILNPGVLPQEAYFKIGTNQHIVIFEDEAKTWGARPQPSWLKNYANRSFVLALNASKADAQKVLTASAQAGYRGAYVTHDTLPNPWDSLPKYWAFSKQLTTCR